MATRKLSELPEWWMFAINLSVAAAALGLSNQYTYKLIRERGVRTFRPSGGRYFLINSRDIVALIAERMSKHQEAAPPPTDERSRFALRGFPYGDGLKGIKFDDPRGVPMWYNDNAVVPLKQARWLIEPVEKRVKLGKLPTREEFQERLERLRAKRGMR